MVPLWAWLPPAAGSLPSLGGRFQFPDHAVQYTQPWRVHGARRGGRDRAILLGPWAALIVVSISVVIQALLFGDVGKRWRKVTVPGIAGIPIKVIVVYRKMRERIHRWRCMKKLPLFLKGPT